MQEQFLWTHQIRCKGKKKYIYICCSVLAACFYSLIKGFLVNAIKIQLLETPITKFVASCELVGGVAICFFFHSKFIVSLAIKRFWEVKPTFFMALHQARSSCKLRIENVELVY